MTYDLAALIRRLTDLQESHGAGCPVSVLSDDGSAATATAVRAEGGRVVIDCVFGGAANRPAVVLVKARVMGGGGGEMCGYVGLTGYDRAGREVYHDRLRGYSVGDVREDIRKLFPAADIIAA